MTFLSNRHSIEAFNRLSNEFQLSNQFCMKRLLVWLTICQTITWLRYLTLYFYFSSINNSIYNIDILVLFLSHNTSCFSSRFILREFEKVLIWESFDLKKLYWFASWLHEFFYFLFNQLKIIFQSNDFFKISSCVWFRSSQYDNCFRYSFLSFCIFNYLQKSAWEKKIWKSKTIIFTRKRANTI